MSQKTLARGKPANAPAPAAQVIPIPGTTKVTRAKENFASLDVQLTKEEYDEVTALAEGTVIQGQRFPSAFQSLTWG